MKKDKLCVILTGDATIKGYAQDMSVEVVKIFESVVSLTSKNYSSKNRATVKQQLIKK